MSAKRHILRSIFASFSRFVQKPLHTVRQPRHHDFPQHVQQRAMQEAQAKRERRNAKRLALLQGGKSTS